jgi:hypothetical protein
LRKFAHCNALFALDHAFLPGVSKGLALRRQGYHHGKRCSAGFNLMDSRR